MKLEMHLGFSFMVGILSNLMGGYDALIHSLFVVMGLELLIGGFKAWKLKKFSPTLFLWGIVNKLVAVGVVTAVVAVQFGLKIKLPLRETIITLILINEALSCLRNAGTFVKGLEPFTIYFESVKLNVLNIFKVGDNDE